MTSRFSSVTTMRGMMMMRKTSVVVLSGPSRPRVPYRLLRHAGTNHKVPRYFFSTMNKKKTPTTSDEGEKEHMNIAAESEPTTIDDTKKGEAKKKKKKSMTDHFKELGIPFMVYYTACWVASGIGIYGVMEFGGVDVLALLQPTPVSEWVDFSKIDPRAGNVVVAVAVNELVCVLYTPLVLVTFQPVYKAYMNFRNKK